LIYSDESERTQERIFRELREFSSDYAGAVQAAKTRAFVFIKPVLGGVFGAAPAIPGLHRHGVASPGTAVALLDDHVIVSRGVC